MTKEEIIEKLFNCETEEDFIEMDNYIMKIKELGDNETAQYLWDQLFMIEEGIVRSKFGKDESLQN
jgi:hypothetical protein